MHAIWQDFRYALRTLRARAASTFVIVASLAHRHRRQHRDLQRRQRAAAQAAAVSRSGSAGGAVAAIAGHQHSRRTGRRQGSTSTSRTRTDRSRRCRSRRGGAGPCSGFEQPRARRGAAHLVQPVSSARRQAAARPAARCREDDVPGKRRSSILSHAFWTRLFNCRSRRRRQKHHAERLGAGAGDAQESVHGRRRARAGLPAERRDDADRREHPADGRLPAAAARRRRRQPPRRRELQPDGAAEAGRDDGAGAGGRQRHRRHGFATRTSATGRSPSASCRCSSRSSATCGGRCSCCSARWRWCC